MADTRIKYQTTAVVAAVISAWLNSPLACLPAQSQQEPSLQMLTPKLDQTVPPEKKPLTGKIEHQEQAQPAPRLHANTQQKGFFENLLPRKPKKAKPPKPLQSEAKNDNLIATLESGIGIIGVKFVASLGHPPVINRVFPGTPAFEMGLRTNDVIVAVDGVPTHGLTKDEVYGMIVGTPNTPVTISISRNGDFIARTMNRMDFNDIRDPQVRLDYMRSM